MKYSETYVNFLNYVYRWADNLCNTIDRIRQQGVVPVLIALSRKMPRFIDWVTDPKNNLSLPSEMIHTIRNTYLTTELALPFIFFQSKYAPDYEFIIVDDFIIHGTSIKSVAQDINIFVENKCHLSSIFRLEDTRYMSQFEITEWYKIPEVNQKEADVYINIISEIVENSQLPIDMEFPIMEMSGNWAWDWDYLGETLKRIGLSPYSIGHSDDRITIDIPKRNAAGRDNDFSKIRFFKKNGTVLFEVISPHLLTNQSLLDIESNPFKDNVFYDEIWEGCTWRIRERLQRPILGLEAEWERLKSNFTRSLCVFANYLLSLSAFVHYEYVLKNYYKSYLFDDVKLSWENLALILGEELANKSYNRLQYLCDQGMNTVNTRKDTVLDVPKNFAPDAFKHNWQEHSILACLTNDRIEDALASIFSYQHYSNPLFKNPYSTRERLFFGETYKSLMDYLWPYFTSVDMLECINKWIDKNIDAGYVVPKYEVVKAYNGTTYWRRYFHTGIRKFSD